MNFGGCFHVCGSQLELNVYFFKKPILGTLPSLTPKHAKSSPVAILKDLQTQPQKSFQDASRRPFKDIHAQTQRSIQRTTNRQADIQTGTTYYWHWRAMVVIGKLWLSLTSYGCHWRATVVIGEPCVNTKRPILGTLPGLGLKLAPKTSQETILKYFQTQTQKALQEASRKPF